MREGICLTDEHLRLSSGRRLAIHPQASLRNHFSYLRLRPIGPCTSRLVSAIRAVFKRAMMAVYRVGCERYEISGLTFYLPRRDRHEIERAKVNAQDAVRMLERFDPVRFQRIRRDLRNGIVVVPGPNDAIYHRDIGICVLGWNLLLRENHVPTALSIVHEAAHARMRCVPTPTPERAAHMERISIGAEIAFVSRLPGNGPTREVLRRLQGRMTPSYFATEHTNDDSRDRVEGDTH